MPLAPAPFCSHVDPGAGGQADHPLCCLPLREAICFSATPPLLHRHSTRGICLPTTKVGPSVLQHRGKNHHWTPVGHASVHGSVLPQAELKLRLGWSTSPQAQGVLGATSDDLPNLRQTCSATCEPAAGTTTQQFTSRYFEVYTFGIYIYM